MGVFKIFWWHFASGSEATIGAATKIDYMFLILSRVAGLAFHDGDDFEFFGVLFCDVAVAKAGKVLEASQAVLCVETVIKFCCCLD